MAVIVAGHGKSNDKGKVHGIGCKGKWPTGCVYMCRTVLMCAYVEDSYLYPYIPQYTPI